MSDIKLAHSVFALPYAILAACLALPAHPTLRTTLLQFALIVGCMVTARTWAMLFNRLVDRRFDAKNPRTARRALASGQISSHAGWLAAAASAAAFILLTSLFSILLNNSWPLLLSTPVLAIIAFYSLTKRFTALCHIVLGLSLAACYNAPVPRELPFGLFRM
jgi:4-hydroxybenzoate polyprenyltransferase